ncbi:serine hydrolase domain-containing protein [Aliikangiella maris]|uniref:Serine hydrolase domain-containing protein n=2 Tax=Aliikangiella maris TaxID=3162458 RepID=A0ABV3MJ37_9GAMM
MLNKLSLSSLIATILTAFLLGCGSSQVKNIVERCVPVSQISDNDYTKKLKNECYSGSVLIAKDGVVIFEGGFGLLNREKNIKNKTETVYRIASLTKQLTAAAIMILHERQLLDIDEPIGTYLADYPNGDVITARHLLNHTAGIPNYDKIPAIYENVNTDMTPEVLVGHFKDLPLEFTPGSQFAYSNSGYSLLGLLIETVYGTTYAQAMEQLIFNPLSMYHSGYGPSDIVAADQAVGYMQNGKKPRRISMTIPYSAGALISSVDDLHRWERSFYSNALLSEASKAEIFKPAINGYGFGWMTRQNPTTHAHSGGIEGFSSFIKRYPEEGVVVILLSNVGGLELGILAHELYQIYRS